MPGVGPLLAAPAVRLTPGEPLLRGRAPLPPGGRYCLWGTRVEVWLPEPVPEAVAWARLETWQAWCGALLEAAGALPPRWPFEVTLWVLGRPYRFVEEAPGHYWLRTPPAVLPEGAGFEVRLDLGGEG